MKKIKQFGYRFSDKTIQMLDELKQIEDRLSEEFNLKTKCKNDIVEEAISFYYNYKTDQKVSYGLAPIIERIMVDSLNKYMENFVLSLNENQHHTIKTEKMCKLILAGLNITNDEELMKILLNKYTDFEMIIDDSIEKDKSKI